MPGFGESDPAPTQDSTDAARAIEDLAHDLRLRQIDLLGVGFGAAVALDLGAARPDLVRRLVLTRVPPRDQSSVVKQETLVLRIKLGTADDTQWSRGVLPNARFVELTEYTADLFDAAPKTLAKQIGAFLQEKERAGS
jgi:pimeloyl-ACP methyl ester carboxylesterase